MSSPLNIFNLDMKQFVENHYIEDRTPTTYYGHTYHSINVYFFPTRTSRSTESPDPKAAVVIAGIIILAVASFFLIGTCLQLNHLNNSFQAWRKYSSAEVVNILKEETQYKGEIDRIIPKVTDVLFKDLGDIIVDIVLIAGVILAASAIIAGGIASIEALIVVGAVGVAGIAAFRIAKFVYDLFNPSQNLIDIKADYDLISPPKYEFILVKKN